MNLANRTLVKIGNIKATAKQVALINIKRSSKHIILVVGAFRTGKTLFLAFGFAELIIHQQQTPIADGHRYAIVGHVKKSLTHTNVTERVVKWLRYRGWKCEVFDGVNYTAKRNGVIVVIETFAVSNKEDYQQLQASTYRSIYIDEAPLVKVKNIENIIGRCQTFPDYKVIMTGNPEGGKGHEFYVKYLKMPNPLYTYIHFHLLDNPIFTQADVDKMKVMFSKSLFEQKVLGLWSHTVGAIYKSLPTLISNNHNVIKAKNYSIANPKDIPKLKKIDIGIDYGESDAVSAVAVGYVDGKWYIIGQYYHKNDEYDSKDIIAYRDDLTEFINKVYDVYQTSTLVICEYSPSSLYNLLISAQKPSPVVYTKIGIKKVRKGKKTPSKASAIVERIDATNIIINMGKLFIFSEYIPLYHAFENARWKSDGVRLDDDSVDVDSLDSFEYAISEDISMIHRYIPTGSGDIKEVEL